MTARGPDSAVALIVHKCGAVTQMLPCSLSFQLVAHVHACALVHATLAKHTSADLGTLRHADEKKSECAAATWRKLHRHHNELG
jgi:hypothetical protein